jgi:hypothetical protein
MIDLEELFDARDTAPRRGADPIWFEAARRGPRAGRASRGALVAAALVLVLGTAAAVLVVRSAETGTSRIDPASDVDAPAMRSAAPLGGVRSVEGFDIGPPTIDPGLGYSRAVLRLPDGSDSGQVMELVVRPDDADARSAFEWAGGTQVVGGRPVQVVEVEGGTTSVTWAPVAGLLARLDVYPTSPQPTDDGSALAFVERAEFDLDGSWALDEVGGWLADHALVLDSGRSFLSSFGPAVGDGEARQAAVWLWRPGWEVGEVTLYVQPLPGEDDDASSATTVAGRPTAVDVRGTGGQVTTPVGPAQTVLQWVEGGLWHTLVVDGRRSPEEVVAIADDLRRPSTVEVVGLALPDEVPVAERRPLPGTPVRAETAW